MIGDSTTEIRAAHAVNTASVGSPYRFERAQILAQMSPPPTAVVASLTELREAQLKGLGGHGRPG